MQGACVRSHSLRLGLCSLCRLVQHRRVPLAPEPRLSRCLRLRKRRELPQGLFLRLEESPQPKADMADVCNLGLCVREQLTQLPRRAEPAASNDRVFLLAS